MALIPCVFARAWTSLRLSPSSTPRASTPATPAATVAVAFASPAPPPPPPPTPLPPAVPSSRASWDRAENWLGASAAAEFARLCCSWCSNSARVGVRFPPFVALPRDRPSRSAAIVAATLSSLSSDASPCASAATRYEGGLLVTTGGGVLAFGAEDRTVRSRPCPSPRSRKRSRSRGRPNRSLSTLRPLCKRPRSCPSRPRSFRIPPRCRCCCCCK